MRTDGGREGHGGRPVVVLVEEHPDHAAVLAEILEERGFQVEQRTAAEAAERTTGAPVLLSTATPPDAAARLLAALRRREPGFPVIVLDGPGRRWEPRPGDPAVEAVVRKDGDPGFPDHLSELLLRVRPGRPAADPPGPVPADPCAAVLLRLRLGRLARLLERLSPLALLGGAAAAPLAHLLERAEVLAGDAARAAGPPPPRDPVILHPPDLVRVRRRAWEVLAGVPVHPGPGSSPVAIRAEIFRIARLLDGLVLGAAVPGTGALRVGLVEEGEEGSSRAVLRIAAGGRGGTPAAACRELARELGLAVRSSPRGIELLLPAARGPLPGRAGAPPAVLLAAVPGEERGPLAGRLRERGCRVTVAARPAEARRLLAAGCRFEAVFVGAAGREIVVTAREALPGAALLGLGEAEPAEVSFLLDAGGLGWLDTPPSPADLAAAARLAAALHPRPWETAGPAPAAAPPGNAGGPTSSSPSPPGEGRSG